MPPVTISESPGRVNEPGGKVLVFRKACNLLLVKALSSSCQRRRQVFTTPTATGTCRSATGWQVVAIYCLPRAFNRRNRLYSN